MASIKHLFHINASSEKVYDALISVEGLSGWWTKQTTGNSNAGGVIEFRFGAEYRNKMRVKELKPGEKVTWECIDGLQDWIGTVITFRLDSNAGKTRVRFEHSGWKEAGDFYSQCNFSWGRYMESLRNLCEKGEGNPFGK